MIKGNFIDNLPKVYGIYTGGFLAFIMVMVLSVITKKERYTWRKTLNTGKRPEVCYL